MHTRSSIPEHESASPGTDGAGPRIAVEMHNLIADIEDVISETVAVSADDLARIRSRLAERVSAAGDSVTALGDALDRNARKGVSKTNDYVHAQPWNAIGLGAAAGLVLGFLLARRE